jgi:tetratricopeptide (TPR) repeat protein
MATQFEPFNPKAGRACAWAVLGLLCLAASIPASAQEGGALAGGVAALNSGKYDSAVRQLSTAIASNGISPGEAAKALYLRGIAYRKLNQPARSISDLGAAMWLGLPPADRLKAQVNRGLAYRAAGLSEQGEAELAAAKKANGDEAARLIAEDGGAGSNNAQIAAFSTEVRAADAGPSSSPASNDSGPGFASTVTTAKTPSPGRTADASPNWSTSVSGGSSTSAPPPPRESAPARGSWSTTTTDAAAESPSSGGSRVGRWINSWKGDSSSEAPPPQTESAPPPRAATEAPPRPQAAPSSGWDAQTQIVTADARPAGLSDSGSYTLQLAASRSQDEAQALYAKVTKQNPALASKQPDIQKTDLGGLGTFYRLQIGPFPDKAESLKLCNALKRSGVDCFLVTR